MATPASSTAPVTARMICHVDMTATRKKSLSRCPNSATTSSPEAGSLLLAEFPHQHCRLELFYASRGMESNSPGKSNLCWQRRPVSYTHLRAHETPEHL